MNKKLLLLIGVFCFFCVTTKAQTIGDVISPKDQNLLIKECLIFKPLEDKIPVEVFEKLNEYNILNHGFDFKESSNLEANGKRVSFLTKGELSSIKAYFLFHTISIDKNKAFVRYYFIYKINGAEKTIPITIDFEKNNASWEVVNYSIK